jgi:putative transcriptional regulator
MIRIKLQDMMWQRRIRSISELSRNAGVSRQTVDALYNRPDQVKGIQLETLNRLCQALSCDVEDLIQYVSDDRDVEQLQIEVVREDDPDYTIFKESVEEPATALEDCDELFERLDQIRRQRDRQG